MGSFGTVTSPAFARGFAGGALLVAVGLLCQGSGILLVLVAEAKYGPGAPQVRTYVRTEAVLLALASWAGS